MIALIGNRPILQVGHHQVHDYDTHWLGDALKRAAAAAEREDFPFLDEIRQGIEEYLETKCSLQLLPIDSLYERVRKMLEKIGCEIIAERLETLAPPVTICLENTARESGGCFELAFFQRLRGEIEELRLAGAEELHFTRLRESVQYLTGNEKWSRECERLEQEITAFLRLQERGRERMTLEELRAE